MRATLPKSLCLVSGALMLLWIFDRDAIAQVDLCPTQWGEGELEKYARLEGTAESRNEAPTGMVSGTSHPLAIRAGLDRKREVRYCVYRAARPVEAANLHRAERIAVVEPLSCWNIQGRNTTCSGNSRPRLRRLTRRRRLNR